MTFKKVTKRPTIKSTNLGQKLEAEPLKVVATNIEESISQEQAEKLIQALLNSEANTEYNSVTNALSFKTVDPLVNKDAIRALRTSNRTRTIELNEQIQVLKLNMEKSMAASTYCFYYDREEYPNIAKLMVALYGPTADNELITLSQYADLKNLQSSGTQNELTEIVKKQKKKRARKAARKMKKAFDEMVEVTTGEEFDRYLNPNKRNATVTLPNDISVSLVDETIAAIEEDFGDVDEQGVPLGAVISMGYGSLLEAEEANDVVYGTLTRIDENTSYIDSLFSNQSGTLTQTVGGREITHDVKDIMENCFDCFAKAWTDGPAFRGFLDVELRLKELLDAVEAIIGSIRYALDIPAIMMSNACSLMGLGVLCPIELAFIFASLIALARAFVMDLVLQFPSFVGKLVASVLMPILNMLDIMIDFSFGKFNLYFGCVQKTLLTAQQTNFTKTVNRQALGIILRGEEPPPGVAIDPALAVRAREAVSSMKPADFSNLFFTPSTVSLDLENGRQAFPRLDTWMSGKGAGAIAAVLDPMEFIGSAMEESRIYNGSSMDWIKNTLTSIKNYLSSGSSDRSILMAKIMMLSTLAGVVWALIEAARGNQPVCDEAYEEGKGKVLIPRYTAEEFIERINNNNSLYLEKPQPNVVLVDGVPVETGSDFADSFVVNMLTGSKFAVSPCDKSPVQSFSSLELGSMLGRLGVV